MKKAFKFFLFQKSFVFCFYCTDIANFAARNNFVKLLFYLIFHIYIFNTFFFVIKFFDYKLENKYSNNLFDFYQKKKNLHTLKSDFIIV